MSNISIFPDNHMYAFAKKCNRRKFFAVNYLLSDSFRNSTAKANNFSCCVLGHIVMPPTIFAKLSLVSKIHSLLITFFPSFSSGDHLLYLTCRILRRHLAISAQITAEDFFPVNSGIFRMVRKIPG